MENEKTDVKDRLLAGVAYPGGPLSVVIWFFYRKDRKGFVYYHCIQAMNTFIVMYILFLVLGFLSLFIPVLKIILMAKYESFGIITMLYYFALAILFVLAASGKRFRIPLLCIFTDWYLNYLDVLAAKAEEAKKKKV